MIIWDLQWNFAIFLHNFKTPMRSFDFWLGSSEEVHPRPKTSWWGWKTMSSMHETTEKTETACRDHLDETQTWSNHGTFRPSLGFNWIVIWIWCCINIYMSVYMVLSMVFRTFGYIWSMLTKKCPCRCLCVVQGGASTALSIRSFYCTSSNCMTWFCIMILFYHHTWCGWCSLSGFCHHSPRHQPNVYMIYTNTSSVQRQKALIWSGTLKPVDFVGVNSMAFWNLTRHAGRNSDDSDFDYEFLLTLPLYLFSIHCSLFAKVVLVKWMEMAEMFDMLMPALSTLLIVNKRHDLRSQPSMEEIKDALKKGERSCLDTGKWNV